MGVAAANRFRATGEYTPFDHFAGKSGGKFPDLIPK
jgi:hypothetical protein